SNRDALGADAVDLLEQRGRINDDAVADHRELAGSNDAGRQQRKFKRRAVDDERVAGIVAALEAHDDVGLLGQPIDDFAFALVAPLGTDHHDVRHETSFSRARQVARISHPGNLWRPPSRETGAVSIAYCAARAFASTGPIPIVDAGRRGKATSAPYDRPAPYTSVFSAGQRTRHANLISRASP